MTAPATQPGFFDEPVCPDCSAYGYEAGHPSCSAKLRRLAGRTDPQTSADAARRMVPHLGSAQAFALELVRKHPGCNAKQLGRIAAGRDPEKHDAEWWRQAIGRRLPELLRAGLVERGAVRDGCATWRAIA